MAFDGASGLVQVSNVAGLPCSGCDGTLETWVQLAASDSSHQGLIGLDTSGPVYDLRTNGSTGLVFTTLQGDLTATGLPDLSVGWHQVVATYRWICPASDC